MINPTFSPGKVIISGDHSVVYGHSGLVAAISLGSTAEVMTTAPIGQSVQLSDLSQRLINIFTKKFALNLPDISLTFQTELPIQSRLGSSASLAAAGFKALAQYTNTSINQSALFELVQASERVAHGNPSGIDAAAVVYGGVQVFRKTPGGIDRKQLDTRTIHLPHFLLINSGRPTESTREMVSFVAKEYQSDAEYAMLLGELGEVTDEIINNLTHQEIKTFFSLIRRNQELLERLGIVSDSAAQLIRILEEYGAAVKVTGGGGQQTGSGMLLAFHEDMNKLKKVCTQQNLQFFETQLFEESTR